VSGAFYTCTSKTDRKTEIRQQLRQGAPPQASSCVGDLVGVPG
jgi:hypothetical protein